MQQIRWDPDSIFKENPYYLRIADRFRVLKYLTVACLLIFSVVMLTVFSADITVENFQYLIKDLDLSGLTSFGDFDSIVYSGGSSAVFGIYRGELAVVSPGQTSLYSSAGSFSFSKTNVFYSPALLSSEKYMLVYDRGETTCSYAVYNSFAELKSEKLDFPITGAALSDSGSYAIVTRDGTYRGVLLLYDRDFNRISEVKKDKYIVSVDLTDAGDAVAVASVYDSGGSAYTELMLLAPGEENPQATVIESGGMPMSVRFLSDGSVAVLYTDRIAFYDAALEKRTEISLGSAPSQQAVIGDSFVCTVYNKTVIGNDKTVTVYDGMGRKIHESECSGELIKIAVSGDSVYLLLEGRLQMENVLTGEKKECAIGPNARDVVFPGSGTPLVCFAGNAVPVLWEDGGGQTSADTE